MKSKNIAKSGIITALIIVILYAASIIPVSKLSILTIASCLIPVSLIMTDMKSTILVYIASSILSFIFIPLNMAIYYTLFFGNYGILKYFIEKKNNLVVEILLKLVCFNILASIIYTLIQGIIIIPENMPLYLFIIIVEIAFLIYDYALTLIITYFLNKFKKYINLNN